MNTIDYSTMDLREELARVRNARRRNTIIVAVADVAIIAGFAYLVLSGLTH